jgi:hypothetical protein
VVVGGAGYDGGELRFVARFDGVFVASGVVAGASIGGGNQGCDWGGYLWGRWEGQGIRWYDSQRACLLMRGTDCMRWCGLWRCTGSRKHGRRGIRRCMGW